MFGFRAFVLEPNVQNPKIRRLILEKILYSAKVATNTIKPVWFGFGTFKRSVPNQTFKI